MRFSLAVAVVLVGMSLSGWAQQNTFKVKPAPTKVPKSAGRDHRGTSPQIADLLAPGNRPYLDRPVAEKSPVAGNGDALLAIVSQFGYELLRFDIQHLRLFQLGRGEQEATFGREGESFDHGLSREDSRGRAVAPE